MDRRPRLPRLRGLSTADGLGQWWAPHQTEETAEGTVLSHSPGEQHGDVQMLVTELVPDRTVEWTIVSSHPSRSPASAWTGTRIRFDLSERPSPGAWQGLGEEGRPLTVIEFRHSGWDESSPFFGFCNYAWGVTLFLLQQWAEGETSAE